MGPGPPPFRGGITAPVGLAEDLLGLFSSLGGCQRIGAAETDSLAARVLHVIALDPARLDPKQKPLEARIADFIRPFRRSQAGDKGVAEA